MNSLTQTMEYKEYEGSIEFSEADNLYYGEVQGVGPLISYEGKTLEELRDDFHAAVDDYLSWCQARGKQPERRYEETFTKLYPIGYVVERNYQQTAMVS